MRRQGHVKFFHNLRGYGFAVLPDGREAFIHYSACPPNERGWRTLAPNQAIEFDLEETPKGLAAVNVMPLPG